MKYSDFLESLDEYLKECFELHKNHIHCSIGCSSCCEIGDYPISQVEFDYIMNGYLSLKNSLKADIQNNIKNMKPGKACPFLIEKKCSIYEYRPIICRVHGLAYLLDNNIVKVPYCVNEGKNYADVYKNGVININPIKKNLDTKNLLENSEYGEIRNLYDWLK